MSAISSAVFSPSPFARVERPSPPMFNFGKTLEALLTGIGGGRPASESESEFEGAFFLAAFF